MQKNRKQCATKSTTAFYSSSLNHMKERLQNLAHVMLLKTCKELNIDPSGTHCIKYPRKFIYALVQDETGKAIINVTIHKNQVPTYAWPH